MSVCLCRPGFSLGLAYAGSNREDVLSLLLPVMGDSKSSMEVWECLVLEQEPFVYIYVHF